VSVVGGIKAAVIAVIAIAIFRLGKTAVRDVGLTALGGLSLAALSLGVNPLVILLGGGIAGMVVRRGRASCSGGPPVSTYAPAPVLFRLRRSAWMAAFPDSVNVCAVALMAGVTFGLAADGLRGWPAWVITAGALVLLGWKVNPAWGVGRRAGGFLRAP
jgi:chromate transport protein ChrA